MTESVVGAQQQQLLLGVHAHLREELAGQLDAVDRALVAMVNGEHDVAGVRAAVQELADLLLAHPAYEEEQLLDAIGRTPLEG